MDALEFLKERKRMCNSYSDCCDCPLGSSRCVINHVTSDEDNERIVAAVEQWSKEHPRKMVGVLRKSHCKMVRVLRKSHFDGYKPTLKNEMGAKEE